MKYIRTKDGIYDLEKSLFHQYNGIRVLTPYCKQYEENPSLCKTADTIKELCDEFVMISDGKHKLDIGCHSYSDEKIQIYGAIWTDKGLIYVAKMNEKGKLELL